MSTIDIACDRVDRTYRPSDTVTGNILINATNPFEFSSISLKVTGSIKLQLSAKSVGIFAAFYNAVEPVEMIDLKIPVSKSNKVKVGLNKYPFEFTLSPNLKCRNLLETYHGVYITVCYNISTECVRGIMKKNLHQSLEFMVQVPLEKPMVETPKEFSISPKSVSVKGNNDNPEIDYDDGFPYFKISGKIHRMNCPINLPFTGEIVIESTTEDVKSIELQLVRVESIQHHDGPTAREATEIQNIQIGHGNVCQNLVIPIYMIFPRLFTCPTFSRTSSGTAFKLDFEVNIIVLFKSGYMVTEKVPIILYR